MVSRRDGRETQKPKRRGGSIMSKIASELMLEYEQRRGEIDNYLNESIKCCECFSELSEVFSKRFGEQLLWIAEEDLREDWHEWTSHISTKHGGY